MRIYLIKSLDFECKMGAANIARLTAVLALLCVCQSWGSKPKYDATKEEVALMKYVKDNGGYVRDSNTRSLSHRSLPGEDFLLQISPP